MSYLLSEPIENLIQDWSDKDFDEACEVLIVGSGYGGAIVAMRLADPNRKVFVFERGKEYTLGEFPESLGELPGHVQFLRKDRDLPIGNADALFDFRINDPVSVLVGSGLGGGSLINANVAMEPDLDAFCKPPWPAALGTGSGLKELNESFIAVERLLGVNDADVRNKQIRKFDALTRLAEALDTGCNPAPITVTQGQGPYVRGPYEKLTNNVDIAQNACIGCANCVTGCNVGAKNTLAMNALPLAKSRGAKLYTGATVVSIEPNEAKGSHKWIVRFRRTATFKTVLYQEVFTLRAEVVILAAGTLGSTEILLRSQARCPDRLKFSEHLGRRFSTNGDVLAFGYAQREEVNAVAHADVAEQAERRSERGIGPTITGYFQVDAPPVDAVSVPRRLVTIEDGAVPSALSHVFGEIIATASVAKRHAKDDSPAWFEDNPDKDPLAVHPAALRHSQVLLGMGDDGAPGTLVLTAAGEAPQDLDRASIRIAFPPALAKSGVFSRLDSWLQEAEKKDGFDSGDYLQNPFWKILPDELSRVSKAPAPGGNLLSVHPLGGCPMGDDVGSGVVNHCGQVFRRDGLGRDSVYEGLYVMDGAIIPCALGVNPFFTIAALAYRNVEEVCRNLKWPLQGIGRVALAVKQDVEKTLPSGDPAPETGHSVWTTFDEGMTGCLSVNSVPSWLIQILGNKDQTERLNEKDRLVIRVGVTVKNILDWLRAPNTELDARIRLLANDRPSDHVRDECLHELAAGAGRVKLLAWDRASEDLQVQRQVRALEAFLSRRGNEVPILRLGWKILNWWIIQSLGRLFTRINGFLRVARNHANWRELRYHFVLEAKSAREITLEGTKVLGYALSTNDPWTALVDLPFRLSDGAGNSVGGSIRVDVVRLTHRAPFQVQKSPNTPVTIATMASAGMMLLRVLFQTHFWSFGAPDYPKNTLIRKRDPGPVRLEDGTEIKPQFIPLPVRESPDNPTKTICLRLVRYQPKEAPRGTILVVHGFALGSLVFATDTIDVNFVKYLCQNGYDVWLLDYRLSIALPDRTPGKWLAENQWTMDQIARCDMADAVRYVYTEVDKQIQVFAHCIGAGSMSMAILSGGCHDNALDRSMISALALHAVYPWVVPSMINRVKANLGAFLRDTITRKTFDAVLPDKDTVTATDVLMDRLAGSLPWPSDDEAERHRSDTNKRKGKEICNRMTLFYSYEWKHGNLTSKTHKALVDLVGIGNLETFRHIYLTLIRKRLTNREGENTYVTAKNFNKYWTFPTLFAHGSDNQVYSPLSARASCLRLRELRKQWRHQNPPMYDSYWHEVPNYGHMDFLFGKNAKAQVYPYLDAFFHLAQLNPGAQVPHDLQGAANILQAANPAQAPDPYWERRPPVPECGPIIGWVRNEGTNIVVRLWVEPFLFSAITPSGKINNPHCFAIAPVPLPRRRPDGDPDYPGTFWVYDLMVPRTFAQDLQISIDYDKSGDIRFKVVPVSPQQGGAQSARVDGVIPLSRLPWFCRFRRLRQDKDREGVAFLVGSCRYPGSPFEEHLADAIFEGMRAHVTGLKERPGVDHVLLVGDQIYADATADMFDDRELRERFAGQYREAFRANNLRRLLASVPTYMALDDHEFDDNWQGDAEHLAQGGNTVAKDYMKRFRHGLAAAKAYQWSMSPRSGWSGRPASPPPDDSGLWYTFTSDGLPFFVMDTRTERTLRQSGISWNQAHLVGERHFKALTDWLDEQQKKEPNKPKFIVSGSVLAPIPKAYIPKNNWYLWRNLEGWAGFPRTWRQLVRHIVRHQVKNVVFVGGDYHLSALARLSLKSKSKGEPVTAYSIVASGLFAPLPFANSKREDYDWTTPLPGQQPKTVPYNLPFSDDTATIEVEPYLLSTNSSHFLRVDVQRSGGANWRIGVSVQTGQRVMAPDMPVPFATMVNNVVWLDLQPDGP